MTFKALVARGTPKDYKVGFEELRDEDLPVEGEVVVDVEYSSLNYKDALAVTGRGRILRNVPIVPGIDLAGTVASSATDEFKPGDRVVGTGQSLGESDWGGYAQRQRVRANAIVHIPEPLTTEQAMQIGTAGFTAMLCVMALDHAGVVADEREVVVTGAAGGVGSIAVMLLARRGYHVAASTGRPELEEYLRGLGASSIVKREELAAKGGPLQSERWAGGVDTVGGDALANVYAQTAYGGSVACCGMASSHELNTTVWPLILRNVSLLGVSSVRTPKPTRIEAWRLLANEIDAAKLASLSKTEPLANIRELSEEILAGRIRGRTVIKP